MKRQIVSLSQRMNYETDQSNKIRELGFSHPPVPGRWSTNLPARIMITIQDLPVHGAMLPTMKLVAAIRLYRPNG